MNAEKRIILLLAASTSLAACGASQSGDAAEGAPVDGETTEAGDSAAEDDVEDSGLVGADGNVHDELGPFDRQFTVNQQLVVTSDIDLDGTPDTFEYYEVLAENGLPIESVTGLNPWDPLNLRIVRKEADLNFDGQFDIVRVYDINQQLELEQLDVDLDGSVDYVNHYDGAVIVRRQVDGDSNGEFEETRFFREGRLYRVEIDTDNDYLPDTWEFYLGTTLDRIGHDDDGDGVIDRWIMANRSRIDEIADSVSEEAGVETEDEADDETAAADDAAADDAAADDAAADDAAADDAAADDAAADDAAADDAAAEDAAADDAAADDAAADDAAAE